MPYCSPIWIQAVKPLNTGSGRLRLAFQNVLYAHGVQNFTLDLRVLKRATDYLAAELDYGPDGEKGRMAVVSPIEFEWVQRFCPELWSSRPTTRCSAAAQSSISVYLSEVFGCGADERIAGAP